MFMEPAPLKRRRISIEEIENELILLHLSTASERSDTCSASAQKANNDACIDALAAAFSRASTGTGRSSTNCLAVLSSWGASFDGSSSSGATASGGACLQTFGPWRRARCRDATRANTGGTGLLGLLPPAPARYRASGGGNVARADASLEESRFADDDMGSQREGCTAIVPFCDLTSLLHIAPRPLAAARSSHKGARQRRSQPPPTAQILTTSGSMFGPRQCAAPTEEEMDCGDL